MGAPQRVLRRSQSAFASTLIHLISIPVTNTSVKDPARSTGPARCSSAVGRSNSSGCSWLAPLLGAALGGLAYRFIAGEQPAPLLR